MRTLPVLGIAAVLASGAAGSVVLATSAAAATGPTVTTNGATRTIQLFSHTTSMSFIPQGGQPTSTPPAQAPKPGDAIAFTDSVSQHGVQVGTASIRCTVVSVQAASCSGTYTFPNGTIKGVASASLSQQNNAVHGTITGGTGAYEGARGELTVDEAGDGPAHLTFELLRR
jgi:hypothetical protein